MRTKLGIGNALRRAVAIAPLALLLGATVATTPATAQDRAAATDRPAPRAPDDALGRTVLARANEARGLRILVSIEQRRLWLINGADTLLNAPAAVGLDQDFEFGGKKFTFATPRGRRIIRDKQPAPVWTVPEWHYLEKAAARKLGVVHLAPGQWYRLQDSTHIIVRGDQVGRLNRFGNWWPFSQDFEIIFEDKIFVPPLHTVQRRVTNALGPYKLDMGDGYLIHGTHEYNEDSIGEAVSHGCVRLGNDDLRRLYAQAPRGSPVYIF